MINVYTYTNSDGIEFRVLSHCDESPNVYIPNGFVSDLKFPRTVGFNQVVDVGRYTSANTGETVYVILFEYRYDIDGYMGYTLMTTDARCSAYSEDEQDGIIKNVHDFIRNLITVKEEHT